ncbi:unnamed protein product [Polarella glacialis]|uniref:Enoyl-CoA hydratase n=1 Tax=Polarella glacialis TaxID=89957 RepID=A0A813HG16_POLGL|nr:unnamed protein product [Polarella glacialis]
MANTAPEGEQLLVSVDRESRIATLTINRAAKLGSFTKTLFAALITALEELGHDKAVSCILLTSKGRAFSAGNDVLGETPPDSLAREALAAIENCPVPVVAVVSGFAYTGALEVLVAADLVIAAESAYFQDTHAQLGLVPTWGGNVRLPRVMGLKVAKELMFTCRRFSAQEALSWGLINKVVPDASLAEEALRLAAAIARNSRDSIAKQKRAMTEALRRPLADALEWNARTHPGHGEDVQERLLALRSAGKKKSESGSSKPEAHSKL